MRIPTKYLLSQDSLCAYGNRKEQLREGQDIERYAQEQHDDTCAEREVLQSLRDGHIGFVFLFSAGRNKADGSGRMLATGLPGAAFLMQIYIKTVIYKLIG